MVGGVMKVLERVMKARSFGLAIVKISMEGLAVSQV